jgi:inorganic pyrophosphatase
VSQNHHSHEPLYSKITKFSNIRQKDKEEKQRLMKHFKNTKRDKKKKHTSLFQLKKRLLKAIQRREKKKPKLILLLKLTIRKRPLLQKSP